MGFFNNLLELSHAETQAAQAQIVEVFERITDGFVALDKEWRYTYINRRSAEFFGRRPEELIGKHIWTEFPEGVGQPFQLAYARAMAEQVPIQIEEYYAPWDRWLENRIYPSSEGISIFYQEISDRKRSEAKLQENERRLRLALHAGHMGIFDWDVTTHVIVWSEEHARYPRRYGRRRHRAGDNRHGPQPEYACGRRGRGICGAASVFAAPRLRRHAGLFFQPAAAGRGTDPASCKWVSVAGETIK